MEQNIFKTDRDGKLLVNKEALLRNGIYTDLSYRTNKSRGKMQEILSGADKYVLLESLPEQTRRLTVSKLSRFNTEYTQLLLATGGVGSDCVPAAIEFTAETLDINEPFIKSGIESHINTHYTLYVSAYMDAGLNSASLKGYAKQCALVQWIYDYSQKINTSEASAKRAGLLMRSFRANLLTALCNISFEVKIPLSEARFNKWLDDVLAAMKEGKRPEDIVQIKRLKNENSMKVTKEQFNTAYYFYINGTNMSVAMVYRKWVEYGRISGWWTDRESGAFFPPTEGRLYQLLAPVKNGAMLEKTDAVKYQLNMTPAVSRLLPVCKNHVWEIDGTAHNENVAESGTVRQHVYVIKVIDAATVRLLGAAPLLGVREPFYALKEAVLTGIRETGYKPAIIQCDHGPAWRELDAWCRENDIKLYASNAGNARAKTIESFINMFDNDITRFLPGFSGGNRTALSVNSRASDKRETEGKRNARSASVAMNWIRTEGIKLWNERIIETLEGKTCDKTPYELWDAKESFVPKLSYIQLCQLCGIRNDRKLTVNGLDISHKTVDYTYFPEIETPEQRAVAANLFNTIPLDAQTANVLSIYILNPGEPAPVFDRSGKFLGVWTLKQKVDYIDESGNLDKFMALAYRVKEQAKAVNQTVRDEIEKNPDYEKIDALGKEALTGKRRKYEGFGEAAKTWCGRYDKSELLTEEVTAKAGMEQLSDTPEYKELVDPDTGEIYRIRIN